MLTLHDVEAVSPALGKYTAQSLLGELWKRPDLIPRDRSIATVAALIARNQVIELPTHFQLALENGVTPGEISEIITHMAFYAGWPNAMAALVVVKEIFTKRGVQPQDLPVASPALLPIDQAAEAMRAAFVDKEVGPVSPGLVLFTGKLVFQDLWLRPNLAPRDRSLITVSALIATGQVAQITFHLTKAMDNGLTKAQASEVLTHLAFYAGWPCAFSAVPIFKSVFATRGL